MADILLQTMFYLQDTSDIKNLYMTTKFNYDENEIIYFWRLKYEYENLPVLQHFIGFNEWLKDYDKMICCYKKAYNLLSNKKILINNNYKELDLKILSHRLRCIIYNYTPKYQPFDYIKIYKNKNYKISMGCIDKLYISNKDIHDILTILFYYDRQIKFQIL